MALFDSLADLITHGASAIGVGGGVAAAQIWRKFQKVADNAKEAKKLVTDLITVAATKAELNQVKADLEATLVKLARSSQTELQLKPDVETLNRIAQLETRASSLEDDFDAKNREDTEWNRTIERSLGRIEGALGTQRNSD